MSGPVQFSRARLDVLKEGHVVEEDEDLEPSAPVAFAVPQAPPRNAPTPKPVKPPTPGGPINVLKLAKKRLREVRSELKRMKNLEQERLELERLIAAATKPVVSATPIKPARSA